MPGLAMTKTNYIRASFAFMGGTGPLTSERRSCNMDFLKIINAALSVLAWLVVLAIIWAISPYFFKLITVVQTVHDFGK
jgi:hypothetical protein